jgi:pimeloyl-ACP methyl ester carboxylesterase
MRTTTTISAALTSLAVVLAASACGGPTADTAGAASTASSTTAIPATTIAVERPSHPVDALVSVDNGNLHIRCVGSGGTTVLLVAGWGEGGESWGAIEPAISEHARVCSYERFGTGTSDSTASTQTFATQATDLHALLDEAAEPGPYVVVGHSFGGAEAVTFASRYPGEVTGLMLIDASPTTWPAAACSVAAYEPLCDVFHDPTLDPERLDVFSAFDEVATITSLGDLPMTVMTAAHYTDPGLAPGERARLDTVRAEGVRHWAGLSTLSSIVSVEDTGHYIQSDQPQIVVDELLQLVQNTRSPR